MLFTGGAVGSSCACDWPLAWLRCGALCARRATCSIFHTLLVPWSQGTTVSTVSVPSLESREELGNRVCIHNKRAYAQAFRSVERVRVNVSAVCECVRL